MESKFIPRDLVRSKSQVRVSLLSNSCHNGLLSLNLSKHPLPRLHYAFDGAMSTGPVLVLIV